MKKRTITLFVLIPLLAVIYFSDFNLDTITGNIIAENKVENYVYDEGNSKLYFCPHEDCESALVNYLNSAQQSIHCGLFEIDLPSVQEKLVEKAREIEVQIVTDDQYLEEFNHPFVKTDSWGLMHNKFCIVDGKSISTGSMNPTENGAYKNNNNLLIIDSGLLAQNYEQEFQEMWNGTFKKGSPVPNPAIKLNNISIENYFCPEDECAYRVKEKLKEAEESIYFMTFSFTHQGIANILLLKYTENRTIRGVFEARQVSEHSRFSQLQYQGIDVVKDKNKNNMHHKVFIIDEETVITGSFNPSAGGDSRNDENILIIKDKEIAKRFLEEFERVYNEAK